MTKMLEEAKRAYYDMAGKMLVKTNADELFRIIEAEDAQRKDWARRLRELNLRSREIAGPWQIIKIIAEIEES